MKNLSQLRNLFLDYFKMHGHKAVHSSSLVPHNDPTLMFTNSGMVQFKDVFTGKEKRDYTKVTSSQKCVRAGGKHNDLDNVGYTARHLTFFEMLGNFSFGDYFKEDAIRYAWELITKEIGLNKDKLYVTVYHEDEQAFKLWHKIAGLNEDRIIKISTNDNFWSMGNTGPCGPCTEIFYDHGDKIFGGLPGTKDQDGDRYIEIWNLVFMQYEQLANGNRVNLPIQCIDTGMGLERLSAVVQGVYDNYEIDLFKSLIKSCIDFIGVQPSDKAKISYRIIADHLRSSSFLIADGVIPSNEGRGYVLRRIIRRAIRHIHQLGYKEPLLYQILPSLIGQMGDSYPELARAQEFVAQILLREEESFLVTLERGLKLLNSEVDTLGSGKHLPGEVAFKLHDTYGFPLDLTTDILKDKNIEVDVESFHKSMLAQKELAKKSWVGSGSSIVNDLWFEIKNKHGNTEFLGYDLTEISATVLGIVQNNTFVNKVKDINSKFYLVVNQTTFYGESGGQLGDVGMISGDDYLQIKVVDTKKPIASLYIHECILLRGIIKLAQAVKLTVDQSYRKKLRANHTATHLLHAVLRQKLGKYVTQSGSLVSADRLRFDINYSKVVSHSVLNEVEAEINQLIINDYTITTKIMNYEQALEKGAIALFGEKYDSEVRVVSVESSNKSDISTELCGGTHVHRLGEIGLFKIISESSIAAGIRRIEAITGAEAVKYTQKQRDLIINLSSLMKTNSDELEAKIIGLIDSKRKLEKDIDGMRGSNLAKLLSFTEKDLTKISNYKFVSKSLDNFEVKELRNAVQNYVRDNTSSIIILFSVIEEKISYVIAVSKDIYEHISALELVHIASDIFGTKGGGRMDLAQGGGDDSAKIPFVINAIKDFIIEKCEK